MPRYDSFRLCRFESRERHDILACIRGAEQNPQKVEEWIAQGAFLNSSQGREYLDVIYKKDGVITPAVEEGWWKLGSEE